VQLVETDALLADVAAAKASIADTLYSATDASVLHLDRRLRLVDALLREQLAFVDVCDAPLDGRAGESPRRRRSHSSQGPAPQTAGKSAALRRAASDALSVARVVARGTAVGRGADLGPIDAYEPTYCSCQQVRCMYGIGASMQTCYSWCVLDVKRSAYHVPHSHAFYVTGGIWRND
jgi:hypothetical protein